MGEKKIRAVSKIFALIIRQTIEYVIYYSTVIHFFSILAYNYNFDGLIRALYRSLEAWAKVRENNTNETIKLIKKKLTYLEVLCSIGKGLYTGNKQSLELSLGGPIIFFYFPSLFCLVLYRGMFFAFRCSNMLELRNIKINKNGYTYEAVGAIFDDAKSSLLIYNEMIG